MTLHSDLDAYVATTFRTTWTHRKGYKVPEAGDITAGNVAVDLDGVVLYADLAESTRFVHRGDPELAAEMYKTYLYCAGRISTGQQGVITAYDGDRVMGVFIGARKETRAVIAAMQINFAVTNIIQPAIVKQYGPGAYDMKQRVGIDTSPLLVASTGVRGNNDLVWVGNAANNAAKMPTL